MAVNFFDTSAIGKHYNPEIGSNAVEQLLATPGDEHVISRLAIVELNSMFAKKVRTGKITLADCQNVIRRFQLEVKSKVFKVLRLISPHLKLAEQLIQRHGAVKNIRTLDAIQLSVALRILTPNLTVRFICADQALCAIAQSEGLSVVNPEIP